MTIRELLKDYKRALYDRAPLVEVVAQVRFPLLLAIEERTPADFQDHIIETFPHLKVLSGVQISLGPDAELSQPARQSRSYVFSNSKTGESVTLGTNSITLTTSEYKDWHSFSERFLEVLQHFTICYKVRSWSRLGLRYRNVIDREALQISGREWGALVNPSLLGLFGSPLLDGTKLLGLGSVCQLAVDGVGVLIQTGLAEKDGSTEKPFVIDFDYSVEDEGTLNLEAVKGAFDNLHTYSGPLFRWSITEELHCALGPH